MNSYAVGCHHEHHSSGPGRRFADVQYVESGAWPGEFAIIIASAKRVRNTGGKPPAKAMPMKRIDWDGRLETGHAVIDAHHEDLVQLFNQVVSVANHRAGKLVCNEVLDKLIRHTKKHFEFEELLMKQYRYPEKAEHTAEHEALIRQALAYRLDPSSSESRIPLIELRRDWLTSHMLTSDKRLTGFLATVVPPSAHMDLPERASAPPSKSRKRSRT